MAEQEKKKKEKIDMYDFPLHDRLKNKTVAHTFLQLDDNANGLLCYSLNFIRLLQVVITPLVTSESTGPSH